MPGEGDPAQSSISVTVGGNDLPSLLARLDADDGEETREAVETIRETVDDDPAVCVPTVPKLRELLECESIDFRETVAYCLAELAAESPDDVAPSVETIAEFTAEAQTPAGREHALRCLAHVATVRPDAVGSHCEAVLEVLETEGLEEDVSRWAIACLSELAADVPEGLESVRPAIESALEDDRATVRRDACLVVGHGELSAVADTLEDVAASEPNPEVRKEAVWALERARGEDGGHGDGDGN